MKFSKKCLEDIIVDNDLAFIQKILKKHKSRTIKPSNFFETKFCFGKKNETSSGTTHHGTKLCSVIRHKKLSVFLTNFHVLGYILAR